MSGYTKAGGTLKCISITGLKLQGATCSNNKLSLSNAISTVLPITQLRWIKQTNADKKANVVSIDKIT